VKEKPGQAQQFRVAEQAAHRVALFLKQPSGAVAVASHNEVAVIEGLAGQGKRVAVVDQGQPVAVPAPVAGVAVLLGDQRVEERRR
jgi:hypothetical protein